MNQVLVSPTVRLVYLGASLALALVVLVVMEKLHVCNRRRAAGMRGVPFNVMRALILTLMVAACTFFLYLTMPTLRPSAGLPPGFILSVRVRDVAGYAATCFFLAGLWELFVHRSPALRGRGHLADFRKGDYAAGGDTGNGEFHLEPRDGDRQQETRH